MRHASKWRSDESAAKNARRVLPEKARQLFEEGDRAAKDGVRESELHKFRLAVKHFRYVLETFAPWFGLGMTRRIEQVRELQVALGRFNDCCAAEALVKRLEPKPRAEVKRILGAIGERKKRERAAFCKVWARQFPPSEREAHWFRYLARYAGARPAKTARRRR